jgi:hypothetical protein
MDTLSSKLLSTIARQTQHFGALNFMINSVASKILPQTTAAACGGVVLCYYQCQGSCAPNSNERYAFYANNQSDCDSGRISAICDDGCRFHCAS